MTVCLHGNWSLVTDNDGDPSLVVCGLCGADRPIKVQFTYDDICRREDSKLDSDG